VRDRGEEDVSGTAIGTELSAWIIDLFSGEAAAFGCAILSDPPLTPAPISVTMPVGSIGGGLSSHGAT
jgi:hypothetical protein